MTVMTCTVWTAPVFFSLECEGEAVFFWYKTELTILCRDARRVDVYSVHCYMLYIAIIRETMIDDSVVILSLYWFHRSFHQTLHYFVTFADLVRYMLSCIFLFDRHCSSSSVSVTLWHEVLWCDAIMLPSDNKHSVSLCMSLCACVYVCVCVWPGH